MAITTQTLMDSDFEVVTKKYLCIVFFGSELSELSELGVVGTRYGGPEGGAW